MLFVASIASGVIAAISGFGIGSVLTPVVSTNLDTKLAVAIVSIPHFIGTLVLHTAGYLAIGFLASQILQGYLNVNIPWWALALVSAVLISAVNHTGIRITTRVQLTLTTLSMLPLLLLALVILVKGGDAGLTLQAFNPFNIPSAPIGVPAAGLFPGILFGILLFVGSKMLLYRWIHLPTGTSLAVIAGILGIAIVVSWLRPVRSD